METLCQPGCSDKNTEVIKLNISDTLVDAWDIP